MNKYFLAAVLFAGAINLASAYKPAGNNIMTTWGENIYIVGNVPELGEWSVDLAVGPALCPSYPTWTVFIDVPAGCAIEWKALKKGASTQTIWQGGENNTFTVPTSGIGSTITSWR